MVGDKNVDLAILQSHFFCQSRALVASYENWTVRGTPKHQNHKYVFLITELDSISSIGELLSITVGHILPGEGIITYI